MFEPTNEQPSSAVLGPPCPSYDGTLHKHHAQPFSPVDDEAASSTDLSTTAGPPHSFPCTVSGCDLEFSSESLLRDHEGLPHAPGHSVVAQRPFKCRCDLQFAKLFTLTRHIKTSQPSISEYPCERCEAYQGPGAFKRKDHLTQHLRGFHSLDEAEMAKSFPPRKTRMYNIPVCHVPGCIHYRDESFKDLTAGEKLQNMPFLKQSDYTDHMKKEHDWSPYPCKFEGCKKVNSKGYFSRTLLIKHRNEQHPGAAPLQFEPKVVPRVKCDHCHKRLSPLSINAHMKYDCGPMVRCPHCNMELREGKLNSHMKYDCGPMVKCHHCNMELREGKLNKHMKYDCGPMVSCRHCNMELREGRLSLHMYREH
ncbi:hypothetical protein GGR56DRAFT_80147 [Xylariaceae sp. FL0804]|nr:hypothetical protein GGR56DRAFT_80147 [Xylariaceae sp. FL0804]